MTVLNTRNEVLGHVKGNGEDGKHLLQFFVTFPAEIPPPDHRHYFNNAGIVVVQREKH